MKNRLCLSQFLFALALLATTFMVSCEKDALTETTGTVNAITLDPDAAYYQDADGTLQRIDLDGLDSNPGLVLRNGNGNSHVNAHYSWQANSAGHRFYKSSTFQLNATENNQGVSGAGQIWRTWGDEGEFAFHTVMDADCISSNGEEAVFTGIVTQIEGDTPNIYPQVGARVWVRVKDNGQGPNAPLDQYNAQIIWNSSATIPCEFFALDGPAAIIWTFSPYEDVANSSDNINVN